MTIGDSVRNEKSSGKIDKFHYIKGKEYYLQIIVE